MLLDKPWRICLLGGLRVQQNNGSHRSITRFQTAKTGSLLAYLTYYSRHAHGREALMELFWPDGVPEASRLSLRVALASLRRQLEPPGVLAGSVLQTTGNAFVGLNPDAITTDVAEFKRAIDAEVKAVSAADKIKRLEEAAALYEGELLPGFYDDWVITERDVLAQMYQNAVERLAALRRRHAPDTISEPQPKEAALPPATVPPHFPAPVTGLPLQMTRFFGREPEIAAVTECIQRAQGGSPHRLLTLTGPGGVGKTRLAMEAVRRAASLESTAAAAFVSLADLTDAGLIVGAIADALNLPGSPHEPLMAQVVRAVSAQNGPFLLVLDNFEQLITPGGGGVSLVQTLLQNVPQLVCLATSRQMLGMSGEVEIAVSPLPTPQTPDTPERLLAFPSVQLFIDRAQTARPDFQITGRNARDIEALCRKLEGIPLAIELAAARASVLAPAQLRERLEHGLDLLSASKHDLPVRHQTLRATMEWSFHLLEPPLPLFFVSLAVFRGGWTVEAAEAVCLLPDTLPALNALERLRERSLITVEENADGTATRFRLLETLREFADEHVSDAVRRGLEKRHAHFYMALAEAAEPHLRGAEQAVWLRRLEAEQDNFRAARRWCMAAENREESDTDPAAAAERTEYGLRLGGALWRFWMMRGYFQEGRAWLDEALMRGGANASPVFRAKALNGLAGLACYQHDYQSARPLYEECLRLQKEANNEQGVAATLNGLGLVATAQGDYAAARALCEQSLALRREQNNDKHGIANALGNLGNIALFQEDYVSAQKYQEQGLALFRELGATQSVALTLNSLGATALGKDELDAARARFEECLNLYEELSDTRGIAEAQHNLCAVFERLNKRAEAWARNRQSLHLREQTGNSEGVVSCLESFAGLLTQSVEPGAWERACRLFGAADALRNELGTPLPPFTRRMAEQHVDKTRRALGEKSFQKHWAEGGTLTLEQAVAEIRDEPPVF